MKKRGAAVGFFSCRTIWQQKHFRRATSVARIELLAEESDLHEMPQSEHTEKKKKQTNQVGKNWQLRRSTGQRRKAAATEKGTVDGRRRRAPYPPDSRARSSQLCATRAQKTRGARARAAGRALPVASLLPFYYFYFLLRHSFFHSFHLHRCFGAMK